MKKNFVILTLFCAFFAVSCGSGDSQKNTGELNEACYPNKTCNEGLVCDEEKNLCIEDYTNPAGDSDTLPEQTDSDTGNDADTVEQNDADTDTDSADDADSQPEPNDDDSTPEQSDNADSQSDEDADIDSGDDESTSSGIFAGSCTKDEAKYKTNKCIKGQSYYCATIDEDECKYFWKRNDLCKGECDSSTGKCAKTECSLNQAEAKIYECKGDDSFVCKVEQDINGEYRAYWNNSQSCISGCNKSTGRCNTYDCYNGTPFMCYQNQSFKCQTNEYKVYEECDEKGCDSSTGKCKNSKYCEKNEEGVTFCDGNILKTCDNSRLKSKNCFGGCDNSTLKCKPSKDPDSGLIWSQIADGDKAWNTWIESVEYCNNLTEEDFNDWRLPTISELRTLIQNCSNTAKNGSCHVADSCLSTDCANDACNGCVRDSCVHYNKLSYWRWGFGAWSSSTVENDIDNAWIVDFGRASIRYTEKNARWENGVVTICVR